VTDSETNDVAVLKTLTLAAAMTAPVESVTVPTNVADPVDCANPQTRDAM
jgi:hypothetical protein